MSCNVGFDGLAAAGWLVLVDGDDTPIVKLTDVVMPGVWQAAEHWHGPGGVVGVAVRIVTPRGSSIEVCRVSPPIDVYAGVKARVRFCAPGPDAEAKYRETFDRAITEAISSALVGGLL